MARAAVPKLYCLLCLINLLFITQQLKILFADISLFTIFFSSQENVAFIMWHVQLQFLGRTFGLCK